MKVMKWFWAGVDFLLTTFALIIIVSLLISVINGSKIELTVNGKHHCYGNCEVTQPK